MSILELTEVAQSAEVYCLSQKIQIKRESPAFQRQTYLGHLAKNLHYQNKY